MRFLIAFILSICSLMTAASEWTGKVVGVHDGDTLTVLQKGRGVRVRLIEIDAPELKQPYGKASKKALSSLCMKQRAKVAWTQKDKYGRILGRVACGAIDANARQITQGMAWWYVAFGNDPALRKLEADARALCVGLWAGAAPVPPWEYRKNQQASGLAGYGCGSNTIPTSTLPTSNPVPIPTSSCGSKRTCGQMTSCSEAKYYLQTCGVTRLDADKDGVPCESLCR
jgi:endonuclease YncB( thermonuclease family)